MSMVVIKKFFLSKTLRKKLVKLNTIFSNKKLTFKSLYSKKISESIMNKNCILKKKLKKKKYEINNSIIIQKRSRALNVSYLNLKKKLSINQLENNYFIKQVTEINDFFFR